MRTYRDRGVAVGQDKDSLEGVEMKCDNRLKRGASCKVNFPTAEKKIYTFHGCFSKRLKVGYTAFFIQNI